MRRVLALAALALAGCGAEQRVAAKPPHPAPTKVTRACRLQPPVPAPSTAQPSARLQAALGVLRRPKTAADAVAAAAFRGEPFLSGVMVDSARRVPEGWLVPAEDVIPKPVISDACLRS